jgi:phosphogluconate dehydratase
MLDSKSWVNALVALLSSGGSTNLTIHLIAMAEAGGFKITLEDMNNLSEVIPSLTSVYPSGKADVNEFHEAGGVAALIGSLLDGGYLFNDVKTLLGDDLNIYRNIAEIKNGELVWETPSKILDQSIIRDHKNPFNSSGGLKLMSGNLGEGIIKTSALNSKDESITAPAVVFNDQEEVEHAFAKGLLNKDCIIVVKGQGPSSNGMPELHKLTAPLGVLQSRGHTVALLTDGRMSGASGKIPAVIHISPEAKELGPISKILSGDLININLQNSTFSNLTNETVIEGRDPVYISSNPVGVGRELFSVFRDNVSNVTKGASVFNEN